MYRELLHDIKLILIFRIKLKEEFPKISIIFNTLNFLSYSCGWELLSVAENKATAHNG